MRYHVKYEKSADKFLGKLDPPQRQLLVRWISDNLEGCDDPRLRGKPLHGRLGDYWRYKMKYAYPAVLSPDKTGYLVYIPDFNINTEAETVPEAIEMARDAIGVCGLCLLDKDKPLPAVTALCSVSHAPSDIVTLVDIDFDDYRASRSVFSRLFRSLSPRRIIPALSSMLHG